MSQAIFYNHDGPRLHWAHWEPGELENPPRELPPTHIQPVTHDPGEVIEDFSEAYRTARRALRVATLQFSQRVAIPAGAAAELEGRADRVGLQLELSPARIEPFMPDWPACIRLGYLQLKGAHTYPERSAMAVGIADGHCLLVRTAAIIYEGKNLGITPLPGVDVKGPAGLDVLHRYGESTDGLPYRVVGPNELNQHHRSDTR